ncbi:unnamed protein product, partial [Brenthis ino]
MPARTAADRHAQREASAQTPSRSRACRRDCRSGALGVARALGPRGAAEARALAVGYFYKFPSPYRFASDAMRACFFHHFLFSVVLKYANETICSETRMKHSNEPPRGAGCGPRRSASGTG